MKPMKGLLILGLLLTLPGCGTPPVYRAYKGQKDLSEVAQIECDSANQILRIKTIDGKRVPSALLLLSFRDFQDKAQVLPGGHSIDLLFATRHLTTAEGKLWFEAGPGKTYIARWKAEGYRVNFWIEEKESRKIVSTGIHP